MNEIVNSTVPTSVPEQVQAERYHQIFNAATDHLINGRRIRTSGIVDLTKEVQSYIAQVSGSPTGLAAAMIAIRQISETLDESLKQINSALATVKNITLPQLFEDNKTKTVSVEVNGVLYRVSVAEIMRASIKASEDGKGREKAYQWLRDNDLGELIVETVNAATLTATAKSLIEDGKELDPDLFNVAIMPSVSVTKVMPKAKATRGE